MESTTQGDSLIKRTGGARLEFLKEPVRELPIPKEYINYFSISCHFCFVQYPKRYCEGSCCRDFENEHPKMYHNHFFYSSKV